MTKSEIRKLAYKITDDATDDTLLNIEEKHGKYFFNKMERREDLSFNRGVCSLRNAIYREIEKELGTRKPRMSKDEEADMQRDSEAVETMLERKSQDMD